MVFTKRVSSRVCAPFVCVCLCKKARRHTVLPCHVIQTPLLDPKPLPPETPMPEVFFFFFWAGCMEGICPQDPAERLGECFQVPV